MTPTDHIDIQIRRGPVSPVDPPRLEGGGGECVFLGRTRLETHAEHGALRCLDYEAYDDMAVSQLTELAHEAIARFACQFVRVHHSTGEVPVGDASVLVQVVCGHRAEAFEACRFLIDALKEKVPIWKREVWERGTSWSPGHAVVDPDEPGKEASS